MNWIHSLEKLFDVLSKQAESSWMHADATGCAVWQEEEEVSKSLSSDVLGLDHRHPVRKGSLCAISTANGAGSEQIAVC